jgi:protein-S-isoprenylcysteine O-methyltransferase Ste14
LYLAYQSVRQLISHKTTFEPGENPSSLVVECPYSYSRNPIYLGLLLVIAGVAITLSSLTALVAPLIFYLVVNSIVILFEEKKLLKNFGPSYESYRKSVRRWI